jgi:hypothetical protein
MLVSSDELWDSEEIEDGGEKLGTVMLDGGLSLEMLMMYSLYLVKHL